MLKLMRCLMVAGVLTVDAGKAYCQTLPKVFEKKQPDYIDSSLKSASELASTAHMLPASKEAWELRRQVLKQEIFRKTGSGIFHHLPVEMLETGRVVQDGFSIMNIRFQTRPNVYATASLYVPNGSGPFPAVLITHGHWPDARRSDIFQSVAQVLVKSGYVALAIDAWGAGERCSEDGKQEYHGANLGASLMNAGESLLGMQLSDNIRAVDLLSSLAYVDAKNIGVTGASGGGNQAMWLAALDERVKAAIPVVSVGTFRSYIMNSNCVCELLPGGLGFTEEDQILGLIAPRALKIFSAKNDQNEAFSPSEMLKSFAGAKKIYSLYNVPNKIAYQIFNTGHGYWPEMRDAMLGWFEFQLKGKGDGSSVKAPMVKPLPANLLATYAKGKRPKEILTTADFCKEKEMVLHKAMMSDKSPDIGTKKQQLSTILGITPAPKVVAAHTLGEVNGWGKFVIDGEFGNHIPVLLHEGKADGRDSTKGRTYTLVIHSRGKDSIPQEDLDQLLRSGQKLVLVDVWGIGEQASARALSVDGSLPPFHTLYRSVQWLGGSVMGKWVQDIELVVQWLQQQHEMSHIEIQGYRETAVAALFYSALHSTDRITLIDAPYSYRFDTRKGIDFYNMAIHIPGLLKWGDIALAAALSSSEIHFINARSMSGNLLNTPMQKQIETEFDTLKHYTGRTRPVLFTKNKILLN